MSVQGHTTDVGLLVTGAITGLFGLHLAEIDIIMGILLKLVSIVSFTALAIVNIKKLFSKPKKNDRD